MAESVRNGNTHFFGRKTGLEELAALRDHIRKEWGITAETLQKAGAKLNELLNHSDNRCKVAVVRCLVAIDSMPPIDFRVASEYDTALALRDLQVKAAQQEEAIRSLQRGDMPPATTDQPTVVDNKD
jgi:hypothetical protein